MRNLILGAALFTWMTSPASTQTTFIMRGKEKEPSTWSEIKQAIHKKAEPAWMVVEDPAKPFAGALHRLLRSEPVVESNFRVFSSTVDGSLGKELRATFGWDGARWALVNSKGQLLLVGSRLPTAAELWDQMRQAGVKTRLEVLESFVVRNPDHIEGRDALLGERMKVAFRRMAPLLKPPARIEEGDRSQTVTPELIRPLSPEEDDRIWGRLSAELERHLINGDFRKTVSWGFIGFSSEDAALSPAMRGAALKGLPLVEDALRESPTHWILWTWWEKLATIAGGRALRPLMASLVLFPGEDANQAPPEHILKGFLNRAKAAGDWRAIRELLEPRWEADRQISMEVMTLDIKGKPGEDGLGFKWDSCLGPLLEARLRLGETQDAERMMAEILEWLPGMVSLPRRAAAVAQACGHPDLAARWSAMKVAPKS